MSSRNAPPQLRDETKNSSMFMPKYSLNLICTIHPVRCIVASGTSTYCHPKVLFFTFGKESPITVHVDNEVSAFLRESGNLLIGQERECRLSVLTGVRIKRVQFRENVRAFPRDKENCP